MSYHAVKERLRDQADLHWSKVRSSEENGHEPDGGECQWCGKDLEHASKIKCTGYRCTNKDCNGENCELCLTALETDSPRDE